MNSNQQRPPVKSVDPHNASPNLQQQSSLMRRPLSWERSSRRRLAIKKLLASHRPGKRGFSLVASVIFHLMLLSGLALAVIPLNESHSVTLLVTTGDDAAPLVEFDLPTIPDDSTDRGHKRDNQPAPTKERSRNHQTAPQHQTPDAVLPLRIDAPTLQESPEDDSLSGKRREDLSRPRAEPAASRPVDAVLARNPQHVAENLTHALDALTEELLLQLEQNGKLLLIWCFDRSGSMREERQPIFRRIERIYTELNQQEQAASGRLTTAVTSFGRSAWKHTTKPTAEVQEIRRAIDGITEDQSGTELTCTAVYESINYYRKSYFTDRRSRRLVLVLVTDESGDVHDIDYNLERAVRIAKQANCIVYVLGREAAFGSRYAHVEWEDPDSREYYRSVVDRGPESAVVEQLQTDGFDDYYYVNYPSGYGPYAQMRLVNETGGKFYLLPDVETELTRGEQRVFYLSKMKGYEPHWCSKSQYLRMANGSRLRQSLMHTITQLDPTRESGPAPTELRTSFSFNEFAIEMREEIAKANYWYDELQGGIAYLRPVVDLRNGEPSRRWIANFDLLYAQLHANLVRVRDYIGCLERYLKEPAMLSASRQLGGMEYTQWVVVPHAQPRWRSDPQTTARASQLLDDVIRDHPDTPWAFRAQHEKERGFGVKLEPGGRREQWEVPGRKIRTGPPL